jgi:hypothetical protein
MAFISMGNGCPEKRIYSGPAKEKLLHETSNRTHAAIAEIQRAMEV